MAYNDRWMIAALGRWRTDDGRRMTDDGLTEDRWKREDRPPRRVNFAKRRDDRMHRPSSLPHEIHDSDSETYFIGASSCLLNFYPPSVWRAKF